MKLVVPVCRHCGVDRELVAVQVGNADYIIPTYRCPSCNDVLRLPVPVHEQPKHWSD